MISDVLFDAVESLNEYLNNLAYDDTYAGDLRARIVSVRDAMDDIRAELDTPPQTGGLITSHHLD